MAMKKIPPHEQALISASVYLNSFQRAIEELVYNSLDAESTSIAIRVFIQENFIQVLDNGVGIIKKDFKLLGQKYATSKYVDNATLKSAPDKYGFRGMSLASIIEISEQVKISSKYQEETWMKTFCNGKVEAICLTTTRPSRGTTVEILGFLYNLNIQKKSIDPLKELHNIKLGLEQLSLIHCNVSISLRDDSKNELVFRLTKNRDMYQTLESLFSIKQKDFQDLQVEKNKYKIKALIGIHKEHTKKYQWIYLNGKIISKTKLHKKLNACLNKAFVNKTNRNVKNKDTFSDENNLFNSNIPFYFIFISCPNYDCDIIYKSKETFVEFKNWNEIDTLIDKLAKFYYSSVSVQPINFNPDVKQKESKCHSIDTRQKVKEIMEKILNNNTNKHKITQLQKGVKGKNIKRKKKRNTETALSKIKDNKQVNNKAKLFKQTIISSRIKDLKNEIIRDENNSREINVNLKPPTENFRKKSKLNNKENNLKTKVNYKSRVKKQSALQNSLIKKLCNQSETVMRRCNKQLAYKRAQKLLNNKIEREYNKIVECKNVINKKPLFKETYKTISKNPINRKSYVHNVENHIFENYINKIECKTSYDLIKPANEFLTPLPKPVNKNIIIERYNESYFASYESFAPITTFNSHNYKNQTPNNIQRRNGIKHFITADSRKNFLLRRQIFNPTRNEIINKPRKNNKQHKINDNIMNFLNESVKISTYASNIYKNEDAINTNIVAKDNDNLNIAYDTAPDVKHYSKVNMEDVYLTYNLNCANTYTIDVFTQPILSNNQNKTYSLQMYSKKCDNENNYSSSLFTRNETVLNDNNVDKNYLFISEAKNSSLEPLNFCETVLHEDDMRETEIRNTFDKSNVENILNSFGVVQSLKEHRKNNDHFYAKDTDFNTSNIDVNLNINNKINSPVNNFGKEDDTNNVNPNFSNNLENLINEKDFKILSNDVHNFEIKSRHSFLPKGMSPIFKDNLQKISYDYDIELDYYDREIYKNFAEDVLANHEIFEPEVVNIKDVDTRSIKNVNNKLSKEYSDLIFDSSSLKHVKVLGQVDQKFIACIIRGNSSKEDRRSDFLALFDQHAVDERVRLENNLKDYFDGNEWKSVPIDSAIKINLSEENYLYFHNNKEKFSAFGLQWGVNDNEILIYAIPKAILGKNIREVETVMKAVKTLLSEQIDAIKSIGGNVSSYPKSIMDLVFSEACRYAIKFGDKLSNNDCVEMINKLSGCKTPFQCAHGRPVMAILMELMNTNTSYKINLNKIQEFKVHHCNK